MPFITLAEQGKRDPSEQIQEASQNFIRAQLMRQQIDQSAQAFPIAQRQREAEASSSETQASMLGQALMLKQQHDELQNKLLSLQAAFESETAPDKKAALKAELLKAQGEAANVATQGQILASQAKEAGQKADPSTTPYSTTITPGKLDAYGNQNITTTFKNPTTGTSSSQQTFEKGRGLPRVAYRDVIDPNTGQKIKQPGFLEQNPNTGDMQIEFPGDNNAAPAAPQEPQRTKATDDLVDKYFDSATGAPKKTMLGFGGMKTPSSVADRAALKTVLSNPALVREYGLNAYGDMSNVLNSGQSLTPATAPAAPAVKPEVNPDDEQMSGDSGPSGSGSQPAAGVGPGGTPIQSAPATGAGKPVMMRSGRAGSPATAAAAATPAVSGKKGSKFGQLAVGTVFRQNGVKYKKTGDTAAIPVEDDTPDAGASPSLPAATGL